jgi:hypothetical protein
MVVATSTHQVDAAAAASTLTRRAFSALTFFEGVAVKATAPAALGTAPGGIEAESAPFPIVGGSARWSSN